MLSVYPENPSMQSNQQEDFMELAPKQQQMAQEMIARLRRKLIDCMLEAVHKLQGDIAEIAAITTGAQQTERVGEPEEARMTLSEVIERWLKDELPFGDEAAQALGHEIYPYLSEIMCALAHTKGQGESHGR